MSKQCIVIFGTVSVQRYIFQSNRLKENIGASYLAKHWFNSGLIDSIRRTYTRVDVNTWDAYMENPSMPRPDGAVEAAKDVNVIYIGGGNAALLCKSREIAKKVVKTWSRDLLEKVPGLRVAVGYGEVTDSFQSAYRAALNNLNSCEEALPFGAALESLPVVRTCPATGLAASAFSSEDNDVNEWISQAAASKRTQVGTGKNPGDAQNAITDEFKSVLKDGQRFAIELDKLGGSEGQSHIAVVHADGNGMGELLNNIIDTSQDNNEFLHNLRAFSASVARLSQSALKETLQYFRDALPKLKGLHLSKNIFPLRPIVYGGDDLTFVCDGRVGLHLAAYYLQKFAEGKIQVLGTCQSIDACAGVAIVPTKFPFAQAYDFADALCGSAKARRREENIDNEERIGSWLDFQIIQEGVTQSITGLRMEQYRSFEGQKLHQRPYQISDSWDNFIAILQKFQSQRWPRSRAKGLLHALTQGPTATERFVKGTQWRNVVLPDGSGIDDNAKTSGWTGGEPPDKTTPYFDPLEALDFYLEGLLPTPSEADDDENEKGEKE